MAEYDKWIDVNPGDFGLRGILQVGQVLGSPTNPSTHILRRYGPFRGMAPGRLMAAIQEGFIETGRYRARADLSVSPHETWGPNEPQKQGQIEKWVGSANYLMINESMYSNDHFLETLMMEHEIQEYIGHVSTRLFLVTKVRKVVMLRDDIGASDIRPGVAFITKPGGPELYPSDPREIDKLMGFVAGYFVEEIKYEEGELRTMSIYPLEPKKKGFLKRFVSKVRTRHPPVYSPDRDILCSEFPTPIDWTSLPQDSSQVAHSEETLPTLQAETIHIHNASSVAPNKEIGSRSAKPASAISPGSESGTNAVPGDTQVELTGKNTADSKSEHESRSTQLQGDEGVQALDIIQVELDSTEEHIGLTSADPQFQSTEEQPAVVTTRPEEVFDFPSIPFVDDMQISERESDRWFNTWMAKVETFLFQFRRTPPDPAHIVRIAMIDTGINLDHPLLQPYKSSNQISPLFCRNFVTDQQSPVYDSTGHGTHCAHVILKTCPKARVFSARVFESNEANESTAGHIRDAIQYCINTWKVDIICMAFSFSDYQTDIHDAIRQARVTLDNNKARAVLFFAAASNHRHNEDIPIGFPARLDDVIAAYSCKYNGQMSGFSPYPVGDKFAVPGEVIKAAFPPDLNNNFLEKRLSGTSATTAIIAGIAGLVIEYVKLKADTAQSVSASDQLWYAQGMKSVFLNCMTTNHNHAPGDYFVVKPWLLLSTKHSDLDVSKQITWALWKTL